MENLVNITSAHTMTTMSSREIAELTGKEHRNVSADIRNILIELEKDVLSFQHIYKDSMNRDQTEYLLDKELTLTLVSGYSIKLRHAIVQRWQELENTTKPKTALEIIAAQTAILIEQERRLAEHDERLKRVEAKQQAFEDGVSYFTVLGYAAYKGINVDLSTAQQIGKSAAKISKDRDILIDKVRDSRFGHVNAYHESVLDEVLSEMLSN